MKPLFLLPLVFGPAVAIAQPGGHVAMRLEVLPIALRVTVTSAEMDFARQRADAGRVRLDPATGDISSKVSGAHRLGEIRLTGPPNGTFAVDVSSAPQLTGTSLPVGFQLLWAKSARCGPGGYETLPGVRTARGILGDTGCASLRFGGTVDLAGAPEGSYEGSLRVSIVSL